MLVGTNYSCSAFDRCFLQSYQESYEAGKELAHGDVITVTYELDAEDECEITMYQSTPNYTSLPELVGD